MNVPDYISPIVGHRIWHWDGIRLLSLNGEPWLPCQVLKASCKAVSPFPEVQSLVAGSGIAGGHQAPQMGCTCGVYATKEPQAWLHRLAQLRRRGQANSQISGEVYLWGTIVEHRCGWRAQFAYPRSLTLLSDMIPCGTRESKEMLDALAAYGAEISIVDEVPHEQEVIGEWSKGSFPPPGGFSPPGGSTPPIAPVFVRPWRGPRPMLPSRGVALAV
jgi:hypothetical protein